MTPEFIADLSDAPPVIDFVAKYGSGDGPPPTGGGDRSNERLTGQVTRELTLNPVGDAMRLMVRYSGKLLLVRHRQLLAHETGGRGQALADLLVLDPKTGIWQADDRQLRELVQASADSYAKTLVANRDVHERRELPIAVRYLRACGNANPQQIKNAAATAHLIGIKEGREWAERVRTCNVQELDAALNFISAPNGVISLDTGELVPAEDAAAKLMTSRFALPDPFDAGATHLNVGRLFGHLAPDVAGYIWAELGHSLRGHPGQRVLILEGPGKAGKSTIVNALRKSLGDLVGKPSKSALTREPQRNASRRDLDPEAVNWAHPRRLALMSEAEDASIDKEALKTRSGGDALVVKPLNVNPYEAEATATTMIVGNGPPRLAWNDGPMRERLRLLPYDPVPVDLRDPAMERCWGEDVAARQALVARLVKAASEHPEAPVQHPEAAERLEEMRTEHEGALAPWLRQHLIEGTTADAVRPSEVWAAAGEALGVKDGRIEGVTERYFTRYAREIVGGLPKPIPVRRSDGQHRRFAGWRLITSAEDAEQQFEMGSE